jgi:hypothetical protein
MCDSAVLEFGDCITMTLNVKATNGRLGLGPAVGVPKGGQTCTSACLEGPTCSRCDTCELAATCKAPHTPNTFQYKSQVSGKSTQLDQFFTVTTVNPCGLLSMTVEESYDTGKGCGTDVQKLTRTYTLKDDDAGTPDVVCTHVFTIADSIHPTLTKPEDEAVQCAGNVPAVAVPTAGDNCGTVSVKYDGETKKSLRERATTITLLLAPRRRQMLAALRPRSPRRLRSRTLEVPRSRIPPSQRMRHFSATMFPRLQTPLSPTIAGV